MRIVLLCCCVLGLALGGCGTVTEYFRGDDNAEPPAELEELQATIKVKTIWSHKVGAGAEDYYIKLVPAVSEGKVFAASRKGQVSAFDAQTGKRLWETKTKVPIAGGPGTGSGVVVVGSSEGDVVALSPTDGALIWKARVSSEVLSAPQAGDGVVVVRTVDGKLYGLSAIDGEHLWIYDRGVPALTLRGTSAPAVASGIAVSGFDSGRLVGLSLTSGQPLWETRVALPSGRSELERMVDIDGDVLISNQTAYVVTFQGRTAAVDLETGAILWRRDMSSHAGIGVDDTTLYVTDEESHVWALDRDSSASIWRQSKLQARQLTPPVSFGDFVVVGDFDGYVHLMRRDDGQFVGRLRVDSAGIIAAPVASADLLYVYSRGGKLSALRVE